MKRTRILYGLSACVIALVVWFTLTSRQQRIRHHTRALHAAFQHQVTGGSIPLMDRLLHPNTPISRWHEVAHYHEKQLFKLGYLTNCEFRLTNQVITREFSSNFFQLIRQRLGTNTDQVWRCPFLTNRKGIAPILPAKDVAVWEQTFSECATRYASNLPPAITTNFLH
jgi:hypothetical protein